MRTYRITIAETATGGKAATTEHVAGSKDAAISMACKLFVGRHRASFHLNRAISTGSRLYGQIGHKFAGCYTMDTSNLYIDCEII